MGGTISKVEGCDDEDSNELLSPAVERAGLEYALLQKMEYSIR